MSLDFSIFSKSENYCNTIVAVGILLFDNHQIASYHRSKVLTYFKCMYLSLMLGIRRITWGSKQENKWHSCSRLPKSYRSDRCSYIIMFYYYSFIIFFITIVLLFFLLLSLLQLRFPIECLVISGDLII